MDGFNLDNLFARFESEDSFAILFFLIGAFLFGLIVNALLSGARKRKLRKQLKEKEDALQLKEVELTASQEELKKLKTELEKENQEKLNLVNQMQQVERDKKRVYTEVYNLNTELEEYKSERQTHLSTIAELNTELAGLEDRIVELQPETGNTEAEKPLAIALSDDSSTANRLASVEDRLAMLVSENSRLRQEVDNLKEVTSRDARPTEAATVAHIPEAAEVSQDLAINSEKTVLGGKIIVDDRPRDPLGKIQGIDAFLEQKLNQIGFYSYQDIADLERSRFAEIEQRIGWLPGRILQDDWIGQAKRLAQMKNIQPHGFDHVSTKEDNLKKIEGIGPKIEEILKAAGIKSWDALANATVDELKEILKAAGDRYRMHNPENWPGQARLAAAGQWEALSEMQKDLKGGK